MNFDAIFYAMKETTILELIEDHLESLKMSLLDEVSSTILCNPNNDSRRSETSWL